MNGSRSLKKNLQISAVLASALLFVLSICFSTTDLRAQGTTSTNNAYVWATVDASSGLVTVLIPPGRPVYDPQLSFQNKSYFTCFISGTYFTNNEVIPNPPANTQKLTNGSTTKIGDTIRTTWLNKNNVDIIQDIYPVAFTKSGQIVYKWKFTNHNGTPVSIACQYLLDLQITDPHAAQPNSNDGPIILTKWSYKRIWQQYPNANLGQSMPWFYIGFLYDLPHTPSLDPGLSGMGYLDYGAPLNLTKPNRMTEGDWYTMASTIFGSNPAWPMGTSYGAPPQVDNAVLMEFPPVGVPAGKTVEVARTSYGTGEYEKCVGSLFSIVFYPHHLVWTKSNTPPPGYYTPNPIHVEKFVVNPDKINSSANTKITLTVGDDMTISDSLCKANFGKSQTQPTSGPGVFLGPGDVGYFDWWACTSPALFCTGADTDTLKFTATCGICPPGFLNSNGDQECDQPIIIDCAETDLDAPEFSDTLQSGCHSTSINVHDWRATDRGLSTVTWVAASGTDASKFIVSAPVPAIKPCYTDKLNHIITITKVDSTASGCFDFTFTDCLGHQSFHTACLGSCVVIPHPDSLAPVFSLVKKWGTYDSTFSCDNGLGDNNRIDSFLVTDNRKNDSGICVLAIVPGSDSNMDLNVSPFSPSSPLVRFSVSVRDSMKDGNICIRATDCAKPIPHYTDTCIHYCTIKDTLAPRISITKAAKAGIWFVEVRDDTAWDRHIDSIYIITSTPLNISINGNGKPYVTDPLRGLAVYPFTVTSDSTKVSDFCIEALDLAGNRTPAGAHCGHQGISRDSLCPNIIIDPPVNKNPVAVMVNVNDIHFDDAPKDSIRYIWDTGVDSVWFEGNHGMIVPPPISGKGADTIAAFPISVRDTMAVDSIPACVTIYAKDMNGNICYATYCYPYTQDIFPPVITLWYDKKDTSIIHGVVTDSTINDRGLFNIASGPSQNLIDSIYRLTKDPIKYFTLKRNSIGESTTSLVSSLDWAGSISPLNAQLAHTATVPFNIWVQDFAMRKGIQPDQGSVFYIPVHFVKNDSIPVVQKGITDFTFSFTMSGDLKSIIFDSVSTRGTEAANWTVTSTPPGSNPVIVVGKSNGGPLTADLRVTDPNKSDSLVLLYFHAQPSQSTYHVDISIDSIRFNKGRDTLYTGTSSGTYISSALMPAPYGILGGSTIVISGACAPKLQTDNIHPTSVSLDPNHPNPFSHITTFNYTVAEEGPVKFYIYDALGKVITRIVDQSQKQGAYTVTFDASSISGGTYVARLETGGTVVSRRVSVEK